VLCGRLTAVLVALDLRERSAKRGWPREIAALLWKTALLPFLFLLGDAGVVFVGMHSGDYPRGLAGRRSSPRAYKSAPTKP
jgi:hypothetical protein